MAIAVGGEVVAPGVVVVTSETPLHAKHGEIEFSKVLGHDLKTLGAVNLTTDSIVALDTETTGLSGGSGTVAFNVGLAFISHQKIVTYQYLLTSYSGERAMLTFLSERLAQAEVLVSYNGKSFDVPLLVTRYRLQRAKSPFAGLPHIDLLHPTRAIFAKRWANCRLTTVEETILGFHRADDLPGYLVPAVWSEYLRTGVCHDFNRVISHNRYDVISLLVLASLLAQLPEHPTAQQTDALGLARWLRKRGFAEEGLRVLLDRRHDLADDGLLDLARQLKTAGDTQSAVSIWETLASKKNAPALECLAKFHEHEGKDPKTALTYTRALLATAGRQPTHVHRAKRLSRKLAS